MCLIKSSENLTSLKNPDGCKLLVIVGVNIDIKLNC